MSRYVDPEIVHQLNSVNVKTVAEDFGVVFHDDYTQCFFHGGDGFNLHYNRDANSLHCFSHCGSKDDKYGKHNPVGVVRCFLQCSFFDACKYLDQTYFGGSFNIGETAEEKEKRLKALTPEQRAKEKKEDELRKNRYEYLEKRLKQEHRIYNKVVSCINIDENKINIINTTMKTLNEKDLDKIPTLSIEQNKLQFHKETLEELVQYLMGNRDHDKTVSGFLDLGRTKQEIYDSLLKFTKEQWQDLLWYL